MIIRKLFKFEGSHIVRNCSSERCKKSIHGHSYTVEVFIESNKLDNGCMVYDFGLMKGTIKDLVDSFDHAYSIWSWEKDEYKDFMKSNSDRWIEMPISPSAEGYSVMLFKIISSILKSTNMNNGEGDVTLHSVRVHETATGYAESFESDQHMFDYGLDTIKFSDQIKSEWKDPKMYDKLIHYCKNIQLEPTPYPFINPKVEQQV